MASPKMPNDLYGVTRDESLSWRRTDVLTGTYVLKQGDQAVIPAESRRDLARHQRKMTLRQVVAASAAPDARRPDARIEQAPTLGRLRRDRVSPDWAPRWYPAISLLHRR